MDLTQSIAGMIDAQSKLRSSEGVGSPEYMSQEMSRLAQYTSSVEMHLAEFERDYEEKLAKLLHKYLVKEEVPVTKAEKLVKIDLGEQKAQITYLTRIVSSAWKTVGVVQSRHNHLNKQATGQI